MPSFSPDTILNKALQIPNIYNAGKQVLNIGSNKESQTSVDNVLYQSTKDPVTKKVIIKRDGVSENDIFKPKNQDPQAIHQYYARYNKAQVDAKPTDPAALSAKLKKENAALANTAIPQAQNYLNLPTKFDLPSTVNLLTTEQPITKIGRNIASHYNYWSAAVSNLMDS